MGRSTIRRGLLVGLGALATTMAATSATAETGTTATTATAAKATTTAAATAAVGAQRRALLVFVAAPPSRNALTLLAADPRVESLGLLSPTQGGYNEQQALLDLTQGARTPREVYRPADPPQGGVGPGGLAVGWPAVVTRARRASAEITPGLLASAVPGGAAFAGDGRRPGPEAVVAADRRGRVAAVSLGAARTLAARTTRLLGRVALVVAVVPDPRRLDQLLGQRTPGELVIVLERPPPTAPTAQLPPRLLAVGATGLTGAGGQLRTATTRRPGLVTGIDLAPTILRWIGARVPAGVQGQALTRSAARDAAGLERLRARLRVIGGRRGATIATFLLAWAALVAAGTAMRGRTGRHAALRLGGLTALWTPSTSLFGGLVAAAEPVEIAVIVGGGFVLALLTDRLVRWPRGPVAPAAAMVVAYAIDLARGSPLIATSVLGSNPLAGSRFFGIGNELEAALPIVLFAGLAAALPQRPARTREVALFAVAGLVFTGLIAAGRLGADVGAVFTIGGGTAVGALALHRRPSRRAVALACAVPVIGLAALAGLDLLTGAGGHYTRTVLHAGSVSDLADTVRRKLDAAFRQLRKGVTPIETVVCLGLGAYALRHRDRLLAPVGEAAGWRAGLAGGFAAGILGSVFNDSGPVLLVIATFGLACVVAYIRGRPPRSDPPSYPPLQRT